MSKGKILQVHFADVIYVFLLSKFLNVEPVFHTVVLLLSTSSTPDNDNCKFFRYFHKLNFIPEYFFYQSFFIYTFKHNFLFKIVHSNQTGAISFPEDVAHKTL